MNRHTVLKTLQQFAEFIGRIDSFCFKEITKSLKKLLETVSEVLTHFENKDPKFVIVLEARIMDIKTPFHKKPWMIAGPGAESQEQLLATAKAIQSDTDLFRAGVWKPRTRPNSFEGIGEQTGMVTSSKAKTELRIATEVANTQHVEKCLQAGVDVLWLGIVPL